MAPTVLVTGGSGLLGRDVVKACERAGWKTVGTALKRTSPPSIVKLDLLDTENLVSVLDEVKPNAIVHCAANRFPDSCNENPAAATALNVSSTKTLTSEAVKRNIFLVYISTDYVFPGRIGEAPYKTTDKPDPPNIYGRTKYEGEQAVLAEAGTTSGKPPAVILRVPLLYGHCKDDDPGKSAVHPLVDTVYKAQQLEASDAKLEVDDWALRYPTSTEDVGEVIVGIVKKYTNDSSSASLPQILQFSGQEKYTKYEMVKIFGEILGLPIDNIAPQDPTKGSQAEGATQRPYDSHLDVSSLREAGIPVVNQDFVAWWRRELRAFRH